jgi:putative flippase GtrA
MTALLDKNLELLRRIPVVGFFVKNIYDRLPPTLQQIARFLVTGGINTAFGYLVFSFAFLVLGWSTDNSIYLSYVIGVTFSYMMFRTFVFTEGDRSFRSYLKFVPTYVFLLFVNVLSMHWLTTVHMLENQKWNTMLAQAMVTVVCAAISFVINRLVIFRVSKAS